MINDTAGVSPEVNQKGEAKMKKMKLHKALFGMLVLFLVFGFGSMNGLAYEIVGHPSEAEDGWEGGDQDIGVIYGNTDEDGWEGGDQDIGLTYGDAEGDDWEGGGLNDI